MSGLTNDILYTTYHLSCSYRDDSGGIRANAATGTGFGVVRQGVLFVVTARHVVARTFADALKYRGEVLDSFEVSAKGIDSSGLPALDVRTKVVGFSCFVPDDDVTDLAVIAQMTTENGAKVSLHPIADATIATPDFMKSLTVGDAIGVVGYPDGHDRLARRPILRSGTIASDPRFSYSIGGEDRGRVIAYDGFSFGGGSGSPVVAFQQGSILVPDGVFRLPKLIGVNAGHLWAADPNRIHTGISYFYRLECLTELLDKAFADAAKRI